MILKAAVFSILFSVPVVADEFIPCVTDDDLQNELISHISNAVDNAKYLRGLCVEQSNDLELCNTQFDISMSLLEKVAIDNGLIEVAQ